jgi:phage-related minor tail protein
MADRIKGITIEIDGDTTGLSKALKGVNSDLRTAQNGLRDVDKLLKLDPGNVDLLRQKQGYFNDAITATEEKLKTEREALEQMKNSDGFDKNSEQAKALERQIIADEQALDSLKKQAKDFGTVASQQFKLAGDKVKEVGDKISGVGTAMSTRVTAPILAVGAASLAAFKEVDSGMDIIVQKTGATGEAFESMRGIAENIATSLPVDFETVGTAIGEVNTRFGATGDQLEELSTQFVQFAELNGVDVTNSIDSAQKALSAFGLGAGEAGNLLDVLNATGQATGAGMDSLLNGLIQNGTAFQEMGLSIEQATVFMGQMETSGANSETVMNGLRKALKNAAEDGVPLNDALSQLQETILNGANGVDGLTAAYDMFGKSGDQIYAAVKNGTLDFNALSISVDGVGGSVQNTFNATKDPIDNFTTATNAAKIAGAELGGAIQTAAAPIIQQFAGFIQTLTDKFRALTPEQQQTIVKIGAVVAAVGPAILIIGKIVSAVGTVISVLGTVVGVLGGPVTIAIGAAVAAGVLLYKNWDTVKQKAQQLWDFLKRTFEGIKNTIGGAIDRIRGLFNFEWHFPQLKLPHFSISGSFSLSPPSVPHLNVDWYRKAYNNGVMFTQPTVLATPGGLKGFGDGNGAEVVLGLNKLRELAGGGVTNNITIYGAQGQSEEALANIVIDKITMLAQRQAVGALG